MGSDIEKERDIDEAMRRNDVRIGRALVVLGFSSGLNLGAIIAGCLQSSGLHWVVQVGVAIAFAVAGAMCFKKLVP